MNKQIAIIGCGNLGRRHLQSATKSKEALDIFVYDINTEVFEIANDILSSTEDKNSKTNVNYITKLNELPNKLDVVVIASSAKGRKDLIEELLNISTIRYMIIEKILFQCYDDYDYVENLLNTKHVKTYVNCPYRYYPVYNKIKSIIGNRKFSFNLTTGGNWGLACNFIHYLDLLSFIGGYKDIEINVDKLNPEIIESKRPGYKEIHGTITGKLGNCTSFKMTLVKDRDAECISYFETEDENILQLETKTELYHVGKSTQWEMKKELYDILYQSVLTQKYVEDLFEKGTCDLVTFEESKILHKAFIKPLTKFFKDYGNEDNLCPIT